MHAADTRECDLLGKDHMREQVGGRAAVFFREADAEQAGGCRFPVKFTRKFLRLVPRSGMRHDLARDEAAHRVAQRLVLLGQRGVRLHDAGSSSTSKCPGATCAPGATCTALTRADCGTLSACSIFIASSTTSARPGSAVSPALAFTATTRPFIGATRRPSLAAAPRRAGGAWVMFSRRKL